MLISKYKVESLINSTNGRFFGAKAYNKEGVIRVYDARLGVKKFLKGGKNRVVNSTNSYITVWDKKASGYRTLNIDTITELTVNKIKYQVV